MSPLCVSSPSGASSMAREVSTIVRLPAKGHGPSARHFSYAARPMTIVVIVAMNSWCPNWSAGNASSQSTPPSFRAMNPSALIAT